jgi:hypothetical protein
LAISRPWNFPRFTFSYSNSFNRRLIHRETPYPTVVHPLHDLCLQ